MKLQDWKRIFSKNLYKQLERNDLTHEKFAEKADLSTNSVSSYLNGNRTPSMRTLLRMCDVLDCKIEELVA